MKKHIALVFVFLFMFLLVACNKENVVLDKPKKYDITSDIHSLNVQINAADFIIEHGGAFSVESNLKYLSVSEKDGVLTIIDGAKSSTNYADAMLKLCVPNGTVFEDVNMVTGAAKLTADSLSANSLKFKFGAGNVQFENLTAYANIDMDGGAGKMTVVNGTLNDLTVEMGVGELNLTAALLGNSKLKFGVGESNLTLIGSRDDYTVAIEKGLGSITVDGKTVSDFGSSGNGRDRVEIEGGVGAIHLKFQEK